MANPFTLTPFHPVSVTWRRANDYYDTIKRNDGQGNKARVEDCYSGIYPTLVWCEDKNKEERIQYYPSSSPSYRHHDDNDVADEKQ